MNIMLKDKVVMIAASSQGIGFGIAEALAKEGARLSIASRSKSRIEQTAAALIEQHGIECKAYVLEAADPVSINVWSEATQADFGDVYGLVINAGGPAPGNFDKFGDEDWERAYQLTLMSAVRMVRSVLPVMRRQGAGSILTVTSSSIKEPLDNLLLSNVFRAGVTALVKSLANDMAAHGIRVNNLVPGRIDTERVRTVDRMNADKKGTTVAEEQRVQYDSISLGAYGRIEDMGNAAAFLLSEAAGYITGATLVVDGGKTRMLF